MDGQVQLDVGGEAANNKQIHYVFAHVLNLKFLRVQEIDCVWTKRKGLLLDCSVGAKQNRSEGS